MLASVLSLTNISLNRLLGITVARFQDKQSSLVTVLILIGVTWAIALTAAIPTTIFRHYWERQWINLVETNCDDRAAAAEPMRAYWLVLLGLLVWVPTIIMVVSYALIFYHLRVSMQKFPYMSAQSQAMRSRQKVIRTLCLLLGVQIVSWFPWQFFTLYDSFVLFQNNGSFDPDSIYTHKIGPILYDIKYYFVFMGSALNPILYGYRSAFMRRAFMVTFPCLFKRKSNYEIIRTNNGHRSTVLFRKVEIKKNSRISKTIFDQGMLSMAPVVAHWVLTNSLQKNDANQYGLGSERKRPSRVLPSSVRRHLGGTIQKSHSTGQIRDSIHKSRSQKFENGLGRPRDFVFQNSVPNPEKSTIGIPNSVTQATQGLLNIPNKIKRKLSVTSSKADESPILILMRKESVASDISPQLGPQLRRNVEENSMRLDHCNFHRDICAQYLLAYPSMVGGFDFDEDGDLRRVIVEVDESALTKAKYNRGRWPTQRWIFGDVELETGSCFMVEVPDRRRETLEEAIVEFIGPGSHVISDGWPSYGHIEEILYKDYTTNTMSSSIRRTLWAQTTQLFTPNKLKDVRC
eukprot:maker-scaffold922_size80897-snap-gene-0.23 protein:Tk09259 transcript:maker-scaffold922_size80897-snap-gene-0.23-mRNA-1 annotation:"PREDICTED: uncharacterized protein LOC100214701"